MNHSLTLRCAATVGLVVCLTITVRAQNIAANINTAQVLYNSSHCEHVIRLIQLHGVNNSVDLSGADSVYHHSGFGGFGIPDCELGDLQIMQVNQIADQEESCGPRIAVVVRNCSSRKVCDFRVTAVAMLGRICPSSPTATVTVAEVLPGAALEVQLQLPIEAFAMGNRNGQIIGFQRLLVAIDSYDELLETNEANNIRAWNRAEIPVVAATTVEAVSETVSEGEEGTAILDGTAEPQPQGSEGSSGPANTVAPTQQSPDDIRSAIEKIDATREEGEAVAQQTGL